MKDNFLLFACYSALTAVATFPLCLKMNSSFYGPFFNTDMRGPAWFLWWLKYSFVHRLSEHSCMMISAPFGYDYSNQAYFIATYALSKYLSILTNPVFSLNFLLFISFVFCGIFAYKLASMLGLNKAGAFFAGLLFTYSPYHLNKAMEFGFTFIGLWICLFVFFLIKIREKASIKNIIFAAISFAMILDFNAYYAFFTAIFSVFFLLFSVCYHWKYHLIFWRPGYKFSKSKAVNDSRLFLALVIIFLGAALIHAPTLINIFGKAFQPSSGEVPTDSAEIYNRPLSYLFAQSARPLSYLLPASTHPVFGDFTKKMFGSIFYGRGSIEQTLYLGWVPLLLGFLAFRQWKKKRSDAARYPGYQETSENFYIGFFLFSSILAFIFSMPPYFDLGIFKLYFPSHYIYKILPMFRAYARFGILVSLGVAILAGFGIKYLTEIIKPGRIRSLCIGLAFSLVVFEFTNIPPVRVADISKTPPVYQWLSQQGGDFIIAEYPMAMGSSWEAWENYDYLYYQTKHQKRMVNGAARGTEAFKIKERVLKITNPLTPRILKALGVKYVILHSGLYKRSNYPDAVDVVGEVPHPDRADGYRFIADFGEDAVYEVTADPVDINSMKN